MITINLPHLLDILLDGTIFLGTYQKCVVKTNTEVHLEDYYLYRSCKTKTVIFARLLFKIAAVIFKKPQQSTIPMNLM